MNRLCRASKLWLEELENELLELEKELDELLLELEKEELQDEDEKDELENELDELEDELENEELEDEDENEELELESELEQDDELENDDEDEELEQTKNSILVICPEPGASKSCKRNRSRLFDQSILAGGLVPPGLAGTAILAMILLAVSLNLKSQVPDPRLCVPVILICNGR